MSTETDKALQSALNQLEKQYGKGSIMKLGERPNMQVEVISTGALPLDIALGVGGIPKGRVVEIYGPEASGKTTFCYSIVAEAQKQGGTCAFIDTEHSLDANYAQAVGVNIDDLLVAQPDYGEQALEMAETLIRSGAVSVVVVDSVAALVPKAEIEGEMTDQLVGVQARLMGKALRKLVGIVNQTGTILIFTNQLREKVGVMYGSPETTPGGKALKYYASVRLDIRRIETMKEAGSAVGNRVRVKVVKNKVAPPFRQAEFEIIYGQGFDNGATLLDLATDEDSEKIGLVEKGGSYYTFTETGMKFQGRAAAKEYLDEHPDMAKRIEDKIKEVKLGRVADEVSPSDIEEDLKEAIAAEEADEQTAEPATV